MPNSHPTQHQKSLTVPCISKDYIRNKKINIFYKVLNHRSCYPGRLPTAVACKTRRTEKQEDGAQRNMTRARVQQHKPHFLQGLSCDVIFNRNEKALLFEGGTSSLCLELTCLYTQLFKYLGLSLYLSIHTSVYPYIHIYTHKQHTVY